MTAKPLGLAAAQSQVCTTTLINVKLWKHMLQKKITVSGLLTDGKNCTRTVVWTPVILTVKSWVNMVVEYKEQTTSPRGMLVGWLASFWISLLWICPHDQSPDDSGTVQGRTIMMRRSIVLTQYIVFKTKKHLADSCRKVQSAKTILLLCAKPFVNIFF